MMRLVSSVGVPFNHFLTRHGRSGGKRSFFTGINVHPAILDKIIVLNE